MKSAFLWHLVERADLVCEAITLQCIIGGSGHPEVGAQEKILIVIYHRFAGHFEPSMML